MVPADFANFFLATAGAGGALIGLLFVAISINPDRIFGSAATLERQTVASSAFTALVDAFFTSCAALIPGHNVAPVALAMSIVGLLNTARVGVQLVRQQIRTRGTGRADLVLRITRAASLVLLSTAIYTLQCYTAINFINRPLDLTYLYLFCSLILAISGLGLVRAWELLGAPRNGLLSFLNPLADLREERPTPPVSVPADAVPPSKDAR